jgi:hypothetical protein
MQLLEEVNSCLEWTQKSLPDFCKRFAKAVSTSIVENKERPVSRQSMPWPLVLFKLGAIYIAPNANIAGSPR